MKLSFPRLDQRREMPSLPPSLPPSVCGARRERGRRRRRRKGEEESTGGKGGTGEGVLSLAASV